MDTNNPDNNIWTRWRSSLSKAVSKYERLRDTPSHSCQDLSRAYAKAFAAFNEVWKLSQTHRRALMQYGLKRSDIGEIASKIGHLHFNWYLRCADTRFLLESYIFYEAIHARQYFEEGMLSIDTGLGSVNGSNIPGGTAATATGAAGRPDLSQQQALSSVISYASASDGVVEQQLRYYARFILVCILMGKKEEAVNLLQEFQALVAAHMMGSGLQGHGTPSHYEWQLVLSEIGGLLTSDPGMPLPRSPGAALSVRPCCRACPSSGEATCAPHVPRIHHAVLVGYHHKQVKLAEFPVDLLRMMQSLEWQDHRLEAVEGGADTAQGGSTASMSASQGVAERTASKGNDGPGSSSTSAGRELSLATPGMQSAAVAAVDSDDTLSEDVAVHNRNAYALSTSQGDASTSHEATENGDKHETATEVLAEQLRILNVVGSSRLQSAGPASADTLRLPARNITSQSSSTSYENPPRTWLYRTNAPALLSTLHSVAVTLPSEANRILLLYLSGDSLRSRMAARGSGLGMSHPSSAHLLNVAPHGRLPPPPAARLPAVASTSCLTSSLMAASQAHSHQIAGLRDASGNDLSGALCLSPPPTAASSGSDSRGSFGSPAASVSHSCLRLEELRPLTRHRLMVVADGDMAQDLKCLVGTELGYPVLALMSPRHRPSAFGDPSRTGQLFTLFLTLPVSAFCLIMGEQDPSPSTLRAMQDAVDEALAGIGNTLQQALSVASSASQQGTGGSRNGTGSGCSPNRSTSQQGNVLSQASNSPTQAILSHTSAGQQALQQHAGGHARSGSSVPDLTASNSGSMLTATLSTAAGSSTSGPSPAVAAAAWAHAYQDVLLRKYMCRFVLARAALAYHRASTGRPECQADCTPDLPHQVSQTSPVCVEAVLKIAAVLKRQALFEGHTSICSQEVSRPEPASSCSTTSSTSSGQQAPPSQVASDSSTSNGVQHSSCSRPIPCSGVDRHRAEQNLESHA